MYFSLLKLISDMEKIDNYDFSVIVLTYSCNFECIFHNYDLFWNSGICEIQTQKSEL